MNDIAGGYRCKAWPASDYVCFAYHDVAKSKPFPAIQTTPSDSTRPVVFLYKRQDSFSAASAFNGLWVSCMANLGQNLTAA